MACDEPIWIAFPFHLEVPPSYQSGGECQGFGDASPATGILCISVPPSDLTNGWFTLGEASNLVFQSPINFLIVASEFRSGLVAPQSTHIAKYLSPLTILDDPQNGHGLTLANSFMPFRC